jgi:hypothetical protein
MAGISPFNPPYSAKVVRGMFCITSPSRNDLKMWEIVKDIAKYLDWDMEEPREISMRDTEEYLKSHGIDQTELAQFRWVSPKNIWKKVESPNAELEKFLEADQLRRRKREVVTTDSQGQIGLYLCRYIN